MNIKYWEWKSKWTEWLGSRDQNSWGILILDSDEPIEAINKAVYGDIPLLQVNKDPKFFQQRAIMCPTEDVNMISERMLDKLWGEISTLILNILGMWTLTEWPNFSIRILQVNKLSISMQIVLILLIKVWWIMKLWVLIFLILLRFLVCQTIIFGSRSVVLLWFYETIPISHAKQSWKLNGSSR